MCNIFLRPASEYCLFLPCMAHNCFAHNTVGDKVWDGSDEIELDGSDEVELDEGGQ